MTITCAICGKDGTYEANDEIGALAAGHNPMSIQGMAEEFNAMLEGFHRHYVCRACREPKPPAS